MRGLRWVRPHIDSSIYAPELRTGHLLLRPHSFTPVAIQDWYDITTDPVVLRYLRWPARTPRQSRRHYKHRTRYIKLYRQDDFMALGVWFHEELQLVGDISLHLRDVHTRSLEIGWIVNSQYQKHGVGYAAAMAVIDWAFSVFHATEIIARIHPGNIASERLAKRLGFTFDYDRARWVLKNDRSDLPQRHDGDTDPSLDERSGGM